MTIDKATASASWLNGLLSFGMVNDVLWLRWDERSSHVLPDAPAAIDGFGSLLIERSVAGQLQESLSREWRRDGLSVMMTVPLERLRR